MPSDIKLPFEALMVALPEAAEMKDRYTLMLVHKVRSANDPAGALAITFLGGGSKNLRMPPISFTYGLSGPSLEEQMGSEVDRTAAVPVTINFVANLLIYMSTSAANKKRAKKSPKQLQVEKELATAEKKGRTRTVIKLKQKLNDVGGKETTWLVGEDEPELETPKGGWKLWYKTAVRGHWRNQPWGPQRSYRRMIWIRPHTRGPGDKVVSHDYYTE